ncbi:WD40-repeat-containing domain protein [Boletus edulis]|nr:WD40-repeat-containing domain protein [Boletus edulis]
MSSPVPQGSVNDGRRPLLVIPADDDDGFWKLAYLPDGRRVVTGSDGGTVKVWNLENSGQEGTSMEHHSELFGLAVTRDGTKIISCGEEGRVKVWDVESHKLIRAWESEEYTRIAISPDDRFVAVGSRTVVKIYSMEGQVNQSIDTGGDHVSCMSFSPNGDKLACGIRRNIRVYDIKTGALILGPLQGHNGFIECVLWSRADGDRLFSGSWDNIRCWNSDTGEQIGHPWTGHTNWINSPSLSPDGSILASASFDKTVRFWNATTGDPVGQHLQHDGLISLADLGAPRNTVHLAQLSLFHPPPPYSTHIPGTGQVLHLHFDTVTPPSNHLPTTALVLNPLLDSPDTSATSDEVDLQYMIPDLSLGPDECQRIFDIRLRKLARMHAFGTEPSTSVFRSTPNGDPKRIRKIDKIKQKLVDMLREIGFKVSNGRLPWSTLEGDLCKKGYTILKWPHGVVRDRDKGIFGLSAEDTDRLHDALFVDEQRIQFIPCGEEPASNNDGATSLVDALGTDRPCDSGCSTTGKQQRFKGHHGGNVYRT